MGRDKAMLEHPCGGTYWTHAVARLEPLCQEVCLVGSHSLDSDLRTLHDATPNAGPAGGIAAALGEAERIAFEGVLVTPVDMPFLTTHDLRKLCERWQRDPESIVAAVSPTEQIEPLVAIYPSRFADCVQSLATSRYRSLMRWLMGQSVINVHLPAMACRNINTPEDLGHDPEASSPEVSF